MRMRVGPDYDCLRPALASALILFLAGCASGPTGLQAPDAAAAKSLQEGRAVSASPENRLGHYLDAAAITAPRLGTGIEATPARESYNAAAAELTVLLRSADNGRLWNHPLTITSGQTTYHLKLQPADYGTWSPDYFNSFVLPSTIKQTLVRTPNVQAGVGGPVVGVRAVTPREAFTPLTGTAAAVTPTLEFKGANVTLSLHRPLKEPRARVNGTVRPLAADFSAPISYYKPPGNVLLVGLRGMFRGDNMMDKTGLYFLQPYDPERIPIVFVHGLLSTPFTWVNTINGLQADPEIRKRYQFWVFGYPTGNPIAYSALRLREELAKVDQVYPHHRPYVLVGHSMGGIISRMQVTTFTRAMWERDIDGTATRIFSKNKPDSLVVRSMTFKANPRVKRVVFVCTPHRGSTMATGGVGKLGISLIRLPFTLTSAVKDSLTSADLATLTGSANRMPNSITGLKPSNPMFVTLDKAPMTVTYHSIIGDRGKGDSPNSTDGVVPYWSSHLKGAKSEDIVPGPHSSCELPQTITDLDRILRLHLKSAAN